MMKKLLGIVVLGLLLSGNAYAACSDDIDWSWSIISSGSLAEFEFLNKNNKTITITQVRLLTSDNQIIKSHEPIPDGMLNSFGRLTTIMILSDVNRNVLSAAGYSCKYK